MSRLKLAAIVAIFAGPFLLITNYQETTERKKIDREGIEVVALPTAKIENISRKGARTYKLDIQYPVQGAGTQTAQVKVSKALYDKIDSEPVLKVKYLKEDPSKLIVIGEPLEHPDMNYMGSGVFAFGLVGSWWFFGRRNA